MAWTPLSQKARGNPLGNIYLNRLADNQAFNKAVAITEHTADGYHNALEVARAVASFSWSGAAWSIDSGSSPEVTAVASGGTGIVNVTLNGSFVSTPMIVRATALDSAAEGLPLLVTHKVNSASSITFYIHKLAALGGNSWSLYNGAFAIAIHCAPVAPGTGITPPGQKVRGATLGYENLNRIFTNQAQLRAAQLLEHASDGTHNAREIARSCAMVTLGGGATYALSDSYRVSSVTKVGTGIVQLTLADGHSLPVQPFAQVDYARNQGGVAADTFLINFPKSQFVAGPPAKISAYIYKYDTASNTWARADTDFSVSVHTAPN